MNIMRLCIALLLACGLLAPPVGVFAQYPGPAQPDRSKEPEGIEFHPDMLRMMEPYRDVLSGSTWLVAQGIDNRMWMKRPDWNALNRYDLSTLNSPLAVGSQAPVAQGGAGVLVPYRDPAPAFSRNLLVTRDFSARTLQTEPHLAVNPLDPDHVVIAAIDYNFPSNSIYISIDGGSTWEGPKQTKYLRDDLGSGGDPVLAFDSKGNVYAVSISIGVEDYGVGSAAGEALVSSIAIASSTDGGYTWNDPVSTARSTVDTDVTLDPSGRLRGTISFGFLDKPWLTIGPHPTIEDQEMIYVTYTEFVTRYGILYIGELPVLGVPEVLTTPKLVASSDGALTWSEPVAVGPTVRSTFGEQEGVGAGASEVTDRVLDELAEPVIVNAGDDPGYREEILAELAARNARSPQMQNEIQEQGTKRTVQGPAPVVDSQGNLYVTWLDSTDDEAMHGLGELYMAKSEDGGMTFDKPTRIASFLEIPFRPRNAFFRYWASAFPKVAVGPNDELYVVYGALPPNDPNDEGDIYFIRSTNGGTRWTRPKRLNQDETSNVQFFPDIDVGPDGKIHVMWGDMRDDPVGTRYHIYYSSSEDQGDTWGFVNTEIDLPVPETRVTDFASNPNKAFPSGVFIGDYFGIAATEEEVYMVWADGRLGEYGAINQKIGFARRRAMPSPEIFLSPNAGPGGETITVQGFGFQPDMTYYLRVGGSTVTTGRTGADGVMTAQVFVPISGEGAHQVSLVDESGNVAGTSFYMEFGFDNVQTSLSELDRQIQALAAANILTTTPTSGAGSVATHQASFPVDNVGQLAAEVQELKLLVQNLAASPSATGATEPELVVSGLGGQAHGAASTWPWGVAAFGGLVMGAALMYVSTLRRNR
ncbi:MAG: hypothetical protein DCC55_28250 [Chloroflexi bacterium]|nr:MAG: hypothetical protein DCC55_28250 [Chloroflexota bacterium]